MPGPPESIQGPSAEDGHAPDDPDAFHLERPTGASPYLFTCDHAGRRLPGRLGTLGLSETDLGRHIAWDIGVAGLARELAERLDAVAILQTYSRLAIDANRPPGSRDSILATSDGTVIPGNQGLSSVETERRAREIFHPYHDRIRRELDHRVRTHRTTLLVALHSFTPALGREPPRRWHVGVLHLRDFRLAHPLLELLRGEPGLVVGDNEPYVASDATDYTIVEHGERRGLPHVELELRQDLISDQAGQAAWGARLAALLRRAHEQMFPG
jgi:predicted N-formylglutamate amidohydrolase